MQRLLSWLGITQHEFKKIIVIVTLWRVGLFMLALLAPHMLPYKPSFPYATTLLAPSGYPASVYSFANFDGVHYLTIAKEGYLSVRFIQAFFPLFPIGVLHSLSLLTPNHPPILIGLCATFLFALACMVLLFALMKERFEASLAWRVILCLLLFPTSFFLASLYNTSLLLCLILLAFFAATKKQWFLASLAATLASATHITGIFLIPALLVSLAQSQRTIPHHTLKNTWLPLALILASSVGLGSYMAYLWIHFHDPLLFFHAQSSFGAGRSTHLVLYPQVVWRSLKILLTSPYDLKYLSYIQEFCAGSLGLAGIIASARRSRRSWMVFAILAFLLPTLTGTMSSMGRYLLVCIPLFLTLASLRTQNKVIYWGWLSISTLLLMINTILFIQGYWVA